MRTHLVGVCVLSLVAFPGLQPPPFDRAAFATVRDLLQTARYAEAVAALEPYTSHASAEPAPVYLLGLVRLQEGNLFEAGNVAARLRAMHSASGDAYAAKLEPVLAVERQNAALREDFAEALRQLDVTRARETLARMVLSAEQRAVAGLYLDIYSGRLTTAAASLAGPVLRAVPPAVRDTMRAELAAATSRFRSVTEQIRWYTESDLGRSACRPTEARERSVRSGFLLLEYVQVAELALRLFPLNDVVMDWAFHGALLSAPYEELRQLGLDILQAKGYLQVPFFSASARFWLVIDQRTRRISTRLDTDGPANLHGSETLGRHVLFDLPFGGVRRLEQSARTQLATGSLAPNSYALRLSPEGQAPHYLFMPLIHCLYGEGVQKTITRNLGRFVLEAIAPVRKVDAKLENPDKRTRDRLQIFSEVVGTGTLVAATAADGVRREAEKYDGRMSAAEALQQTAGDAQAVMSRRRGLLEARESLLASQREAGRTWSGSLAAGALDKTRGSLHGRLEELIAFTEIR